MSSRIPQAIGPPPKLSEDDKRTLLRLARDTLRLRLEEGRHAEPVNPSAQLREPRGAFVTLRRRDSGQLRGCRGQPLPRQPLVEAVVEATLASATDDPRFPPVEPGEVEDLTIEISVLSPLAPAAAETVSVGRHGLLIVCDDRSGLLLPQVALRFGWTREEFLRALCEKASLPADAWRLPEARLFTFETEVWGDAEAGPNDAVNMD